MKAPSTDRAGGAGRLRRRPKAAAGDSDAGQPLQRRVRLKDEEWAGVRWNRRGALPAPPAQPFDLEACLTRLDVVCRGVLERGRVRANIPPHLSREEAWFWLRCLDLRCHHKGWERDELRAAHSGAAPSDAQVLAWGENLAARADCLYYEVPHAFLPFLSPVQIALLLVKRVESELSKWQRLGAFAPARGFATYIVPYLKEQDCAALRQGLEQAYDASCDEEHRRAAPVGTQRAQLLLALLSTVGAGTRLPAYLAGLPDGAWSGDPELRLWTDLSAGHLELLAQLDDEASFVHAARRLGCVPTQATEQRLWLAATEWRELGVLKDWALHALYPEADEVARHLALVEAPEAALPLLELLPHVGTGVPQAARWFAAQPLPATVGLTPVAMGAGELATAARAQLRAVHARDPAAVQAARAHLTAAQDAWLQQEVLTAQPEGCAADELPEALRTALSAVQPARPAAWLDLPALPPILVSGKPLAPVEVKRVLAALAEDPFSPLLPGCEPALLDILKQHAVAASLDAFALALYLQWEYAHGPPREKWALWAAARLGGEACARTPASAAGQARKSPVLLFSMSRLLHTA